MIPRRSRLALWGLLLIALGCLLIIFVRPGRPVTEYVAIGVLFGTLFGQTTLAAAWTAWGPWALVYRAPLSLVWVGLLTLSLAVQASLNYGPPAEAILFFGGCLLGQWLALQGPLWGLAILCGLRLRRPEDEQHPPDPRERQFGIRQLMIFTAIVGVLLGLGRIVVGQLGPRIMPDNSRDMAVIVFLAAAAVAVTLPLLLAALLPRLAVPAVLLVLILIGLATAWELPLLDVFDRHSGPETMHFVWINAITSGWILIFAIAVRLNGYRLAIPGSPKAAPPPP